MLNTKKRLTSLVLSLMLVLSVFAYFPTEIKVNADSEETNITQSAETDFEYNVLENSSIEITKYTGNTPYLVIPEIINGYIVSAIANSAFENYTDLIAITLPNTVTSIGMCAFRGCENLNTITISTNLLSIGSCAFLGCENLLSIKLPLNIATLEELSIGYSGSVTFSENSQIESAERTKIPNVKIYGYPNTPAETYANENDIIFIKIQENEKPKNPADDFEYTVFEDGTAAITEYIGYDSEVEIPAQIDGYTVTSIADFAFEYDGDAVKVILPSTLTSIGEGAFGNCKYLTTIEIPESVTFIGDSAFYNCEKLTAINLPSNITAIGNSVFYGCDSLTEINIPDSVTSIGNSTFCSCENLYEVILPENVTTIGDCAFEYCTELTLINMPSKLTQIGEWAFEDCSFEEIIIPEGVTSIGEFAFFGCEKLKSVVLPSTITTIKSNTFSQCMRLTSVTIPNGVRYIENSVFDGCSRLASIELPESVTTIGEYVFEDCTALTSITIPNKVTEISKGIFYKCSSLTSVNIPYDITSIGDYAFQYCSNLQQIIIQDFTSIGSYAFDSCENLTIYGYKNSEAESYASWEQIPFVDLEINPIITEPTTTETSTTTTTTSTTPTETTTFTTPIETTTSTSETTTEPVVTIPTKLTVTIKSVTPTTAKIFIERTGDVKGAISYVLLKGDYSTVDFSNATMPDMKNHPDFVEFKTSNWTRNCNFNLTYLDKNQTYTVIPITQRRGPIYFFGIGENTTFTTPDITISTTINKITANTVQFRLSRTGIGNGALDYVLLKGDYSKVNYKTLEEYTSMSDFVSYRTSSWSGGVTLTNKSLESGETYTIIPYTQKKNNFYFGLGENTVFTAK